jgi:hypothetical protein
MDFWSGPQKCPSFPDSLIVYLVDVIDFMPHSMSRWPMQRREKRSVKLTVRMRPKEFEQLQEAARKRWPGLEGIVSKSDVLRCFALLGVKQK